jgi:polar amino acid transport system substrate-binding protein
MRLPSPFWQAFVLSAALLLPQGARAQAEDHPADRPLVVGSDFGLAPWMVRQAGGPEGFGAELADILAKRLHRPGVEIVDVNFSNLFAALFAKRIEFTINPLNITAERADRMLFSEPFFATGNGFLIRTADKMTGFDDLKGKVLAVNRGTISDTWATQNAEKYGFEVQRYETFPDSVQAVITRRAFTALNEVPTTIYAASRNKAVKVGFQDLNGRNFGLAFRPDDSDYRDKVENVLECLKHEGVLHRLYLKWYGQEPPAGTALDEIFPGYGPVGMKGYVDTLHSLRCD